MYIAYKKVYSSMLKNVLDIIELPLMYALDNQGWDSAFLKQLNQKNNIAYYQFNLKNICKY